MKYATSIAHGFFFASRNTVTSCRPERPTRTRAWRSDCRTPRSDVSMDQCPRPCRAVSAPATAFCSAAMAGTSASVASRNRISSKAGIGQRCTRIRTTMGTPSASSVRT